MAPEKRDCLPPETPSKLAAFSERLRQSLGKGTSKHRGSRGLEWANLPSAAAADFGWEEKLSPGTDVLEVWFAGCHCGERGISASTYDQSVLTEACPPCRHRR